MNKKIVLYCGPKMSGKDYSINHLRSVGIDLEVAECKTQLHKLTMDFFCVSEKRYWEIYNNRDLKEVALPEFKVTLTKEDQDKLEEVLGIRFTSNVVELSIREAMIFCSEVLVKPRLGNEYFGKARMTQIRNSDSKWFTDSSTGFIDELKPLISFTGLGQPNILLLRIHRQGYTFVGDSRSYIPDGIIDNTIDIYNNGTEEEYFLEVEKHVKKFLGIE